MRIGMMNDPRRDPLAELRWAAEHGFEVMDLTLEPPQAEPGRVPARKLRREAERLGMDLVGHTAWFLPLGSPVRRLREAAVAELAHAMEVLAEAGATLVNLHPYLGAGSMVPRTRTLAWCADSLAELADCAEARGLRPMVENLPDLTKVEDMGRLLKDPRLGFHLDLAHASIGEDRVPALLERFADRVLHVHLSDNTTQRDDHLPLGAGRIAWKRAIRALKATGYDGAITLEVFSRDRGLLDFSRRQLREAWDEAEPPGEARPRPA